MSVKIPTNRELVDEIFTDSVEIVHDVSERFAQDIKIALKEILVEYDEMEEEIEFINELNEKASKHIEKLEAMLDRRGVKYKEWSEVC